MGPRRRHGTPAPAAAPPTGAARHRRHRQPRGVDPPLRPSGGASSIRSGSAQIGDSTLLPKTHGITDEDLKRLPASLVGGPPAESSSNAYEAIEKLRRVYCSTTGFDIAHLFVPEERAWMREAAESGRYLPLMDRESSEALLDRLTQVEVFERFLQRTFTGKTRFSVEGLDMLIPVLDEIIAGAAGTGTRHHDARHGAPRPPQRAGARPAEAVLRRSWPSSRIRSRRRRCGWISAGWAT